EVEGVVGQAAAQEAARIVSGTAQHRSVRQPHDARSAREEYPLCEAHQYPHRRRAQRAQREQQLRLEADVCELLADQKAAQHLKTLASSRRLERAVIDLADELGTDEDVEVQLEPRQSPRAAERP